MKVVTTVYLDKELMSRARFRRGELSEFVNEKIKERAEEKEGVKI